MTYTRPDHIQFLEEELKAITDEFQKKLDTKAAFLLQEKGEIFIAQFITFRENGEMILKFPNTRSLPRKGDHLYCFTVPKELRDYRIWGSMTYGDLLRQHNNHSDVVCIWQEKDRGDDRFSIVGFRGVDIEFARNIAPAQFVEPIQENTTEVAIVSTDSIIRKDGIILLLGPKKPPIEYLANLQKIVQNKSIESVNKILDQDFIQQNNTPLLLNSKKDISSFIVSQFEFDDTLILQGPPGTGKTYLIAQICEKLCKQNKSVLVMALTNRALIEVAEKPTLEQMLKEGKIYKTNLSTDETKEVKNLQLLNNIVPMPGQLALSTFYASSETAANPIEQGQNFDYIIVDEGSQAFLSTLAMSKILGKNTMWVGDCKQLAPIILINEDRINAKRWNLLSDGFLAMTEYSINPSYQLTDSYRLTDRATQYTGCFYNNTLKSKADSSTRIFYSEMPSEIGKFFNPQGGPTLLKTDLNIGETTPQAAIMLTAVLVIALLQTKKMHISVLTKRIVTVKALQKAIYPAVGNHKNLLIETVDKVQGLTTDVTIYVIPNTGYYYSLDKRLFNVATSRSKRHTIIIADKDILDNPHIDKEVKAYLQKLDKEFSFYVSFNTTENNFLLRQ
jgi:Cdc6-like AAA superfamily ATPase